MNSLHSLKIVRVVFYCLKLKEITIPDSVTTIGGDAFAECSSMKRASLGTGVITIGVRAFSDCYYLTDITIPDTVTTIGGKAFAGCYDLEFLAIPDSVTSIGYRAFYYCSKLLSLTIGNGVTEIGDEAFLQCRKLQFVKTDNEYVAGWFAENCPDVRVIGLDDDDLIFKVNGIRYLLAEDGTATVFDVVAEELGKDVVIPATVNGHAVTAIGDKAFFECYRLKSLTIPGSVKTLGQDAFFDCWHLESVTMGEGLTTIGVGAISECPYLTSLEIPASVTSIENYAFEYDDSLTELHFAGNPPAFGKESYPLPITFYVPPTPEWEAWEAPQGVTIVFEAPALTIALVPGWNLVTLKLPILENAKETFLELRPMQFDGGSHSFIRCTSADDLKIGLGYWIFSVDERKLKLARDMEQTGWDSPTLVQGWSLLGVDDKSTWQGEASTARQWLDGRFQNIDNYSLKPGQAYWVK